MGVATRHLEEEITHWPVTGSDGFGGFTFGAPALLEGRWEQKSELFVNFDLEEVLSMAVVYVDKDVDEGDFLGRGDQTAEADPTASSATGFRIRNFASIPDLHNLDVLRKVWL